MPPDRAPQNGSGAPDPPAPIMQTLMLLFLFLWLPAGIAATIWWFQ